MSNFWSTRYQKVEDPPCAPTYTPKNFMVERHTCTDPLCAIIFTLCLGATGYIMAYAFQNGDPRKVYHGMDYKGSLCGVDEPAKPYVFWCAAQGGGWPKGSYSPVTKIDFQHPICVDYCPNSPATQHECYDEITGKSKSVTDYATHPVAKRYCMPQAGDMMHKFNDKMGGHVIEKYLPLVVSTVRQGWPCLLGAFGLAFLLSFLYLLALECFAGLVLWGCLMTLVIFPAAIGGNLIYFSFHDGVDGMPNSGDAQTDLYIGIGCCVASAFFLLVCCCMAGAVNKAGKSVESAAACMFHAKSLLIEPVLNLSARIVLWAFMAAGFAWLISVGDVRKSKIYRTFEYSSEEWIMIVFYLMMMLWLNDLCNAVSQYVVANATARWYFTEQVGGTKLVPSCLLCKGYISGFIFHFGSLAYGSLVIAITRPIRMVLLVFLFAGDVTDNATCGCLSSACGCCVGCFENVLMHLSKNAYIEMAISSTGFCASGRAAVQLLATESKAIAALQGATWLFTLSGLASVSIFGSFITSFIVQNTEAFNSPSSKYYIQDPMVMAACAGVVCFFVALCFMLVFDSVADTMLVCLAYDMKDQRENPLPMMPKAAPPPQQSLFQSFFNTAAADAKTALPAGQKRPQYMHDKLQQLINQGPK